MKENISARRNWLGIIFEWTAALVAALLVLVAVFTFFLRIVRVEGDSMLSTLRDGEQLLVATAVSDFQHGDIVVIDRYAVDPLIKRVVAVSGDTLRITRDGQVLLNGSPLSEPYAQGVTHQKECTDTVIVPSGYVFVMGDNRPFSLDSRSEEIGLVLEKDIIGKAICRILPLPSFGGIYDNMEQGVLNEGDDR